MAHAAAQTHSHAEEFDAHGHKSHGHIIVSVWTLRAVLLTLLFFTLLTSGAAVAEEWISMTFHMEIPQWVNAAVALSIAVVKTTLVVMFFMQLKYDNPLNTMIFVFTIITVGFFLGFTSLDVGQRQTIDRFKASYIHEGGSLGMGGTSQYIADRIKRLQARVAEVKGPALPTDLSLVDLAKLEEQYGLREPHHGPHAHEAEGALAVDAGYRREQPASGSSEKHSRPVKGLTLPEFAPAKPAGEHDVHDPSASTGQPTPEHSPEAKPAKQ